MKRPLYYLLCAIACTSMVSATMPMAAIADAIQPQETAEQQAQADATSSDTDKIEETTSSNATDSSDPTSDTQGNSDTPVDATNATDTPTPATPNPQPSLRAQANSTPEAITTAAETGYAHNVTANQNGVTLTLSWDDAAAGEPTRFHLSATGGSGAYKFRMDAPFYMNPGEGYFGEMVADTSRGQWMTWTSSDTGCDYEFTMTASGRYYYRFYLQDAQSSVWSLRVAAEAEVSDDAHPSIDQIITNAVAQCRQETSGSEYDMALWLHDWTLDQLEYDHDLNWCSAESGLTRHQGTCESYQRIYSKLLNAAGIANGRITGNGHTWNAVKIDGKWCQMDLTWDDTSENWYGDLDQRHLYFGLTDELMAIAHSDHTANYQKDDYAYRSTDLSNNYFVRNGKADEWAEKYAERIQQHLDAKEENFSIDADNQSFPPSISGIQNGIVAYAMNQKKWSVGNSATDPTTILTFLAYSQSDQDAAFEFAVKYMSQNDESKFTSDLDYALVYDHDYYVSHHPDVAEAFGGNEAATFRHFLVHGMTEGRRAISSFDAREYSSLHKDVRAAYGDNWEKYYTHYMKHGKAEGRAGRAYIPGGLDYALVYDHDYYVSHHPDVAEAFGGNEAATFRHFLVHGMTEGRRAISSFDAREYSSLHKDVRAAYGDNWEKYYTHYMKHGKAEGRAGRRL